MQEIKGRNIIFFTRKICIFVMHCEKEVGSAGMQPTRDSGVFIQKVKIKAPLNRSFFHLTSMVNILAIVLLCIACLRLRKSETRA